MSGKYKKGKNPSEIDSWLSTMGYYRKNIAYDETCLFRAVSEQLYYSQVYHERVRKECIEYANSNYSEFKYLMKSEHEWNERMENLAKHMLVCGDIELQIISKKYKKDVIVFDGINFQMENVTKNDYDDILRLCLVSKDHYDVVYKQEHIVTAGFCQSIVYGLLYENVLDIQNVSSIVHTMLYDKSTPITPTIECVNEENSSAHENVPTCTSLVPQINYNKHCDDCTKASIPFPLYGHPPVAAPFPYKVAKALDPNIYRNIEYDTWTEIRRELRIGDWYYGDENLILGTSCNLHTKEGKLNCYIQELFKNENKCVVFITSLAERRTVNYTDLSPEDNAKPWPLPYRFSKHLVLSPPPINLQLDKKLLRKRKDKKRYKGDGSSLTTDGESESNVTAYEGCPLQIQTPVETTEAEVQPSTPIASVPVFDWSSQWPKAPQLTPEPLIWQHTPTTPNVYTAPEIVPYDANVPSPYIYTYSSPPQFSCAVWPTPEYLMTPPQPAGSPNVVVETDTQQVNSALSPQSPIYPMYSVPPGSPIVYTAPEMPDLVMSAHPSSVPMFSPPIDMQYMTSSPFIYPTSPPATWYPPGVNSQGFIFPTPVNNTNRF